MRKWNSAPLAFALLLMLQACYLGDRADVLVPQVSLDKNSIPNELYAAVDEINNRRCLSGYKKIIAARGIDIKHRIIFIADAVSITRNIGVIEKEKETIEALFYFSKYNIGRFYISNRQDHLGRIQKIERDLGVLLNIEAGQQNQHLISTYIKNLNRYDAKQQCSWK